jgi:hypothetical protein
MEHETSKEKKPQMRNLGETLTPHKYQATYVRQGTQGKNKSVLLIKLRDENNHELCDHIWIRYTNAMSHLNSGDTIVFTATPVRYIKGYSGANHRTSDFQTDVTLSDIVQIRVLGNNPVIEKRTKLWNDKLQSNKT